MYNLKAIGLKDCHHIVNRAAFWY